MAEVVIAKRIACGAWNQQFGRKPCESTYAVRDFPTMCADLHAWRAASRARASIDVGGNAAPSSRSIVHALATSTPFHSLRRARLRRARPGGDNGTNNRGPKRDASFTNILNSPGRASFGSFGL